jgi:hypothetical protein
MTSKWLRLAAPLALLGALGCDFEHPYASAIDVDAAVATAEALSFVDHGRRELVFFIPGESDHRLVRHGLVSEGEKVLWTTANLDKSELLVLTGPEDAKQEHVEETLHRLDAKGEELIESYEVRAPFNASALSPDGTHVVLYFDNDLSDVPLSNANQVSIIDLKAGEVRNLTLNGFGGRLQDVHFPGQLEEGVEAPVDVGGIERDIVAFLAQGEVVLVDMANEEADQVAVSFGDEPFTPADTLLRPGDDLVEKPSLFVRSSTGADVAILALFDKEDEETGDAGFSVEPGLISVGTGASDFVYHDEEEIPYLITANSHSQEFVFTDIRTHGNFTVDAEGALAKVFLRDAQRGDVTVRQAVGWSPGGVQVHTVDLDGISNSIGRKSEHLNVAGGIDDLVTLDNDRLLISSGSLLYVLDLHESQVTPLTAESPYDPRASALDGDLLLLGTTGQAWISSVDLLALNPESMVLDDPISAFHYLPETGKVVAEHSHRFGHVTVADARDPSRTTSYSSWGFLLDDILEAK